MAWYDVFSNFYDKSLEELYRSGRQSAVEALQLNDGDVVLDVGCGTGQNFDPIIERIGKDGVLVGVDLSEGMLKKARERSQSLEGKAIHLLKKSASEIDASDLQPLGIEKADAVIIALALSVIPRWEQALEAALALLKPGGRISILDVHAERWVPQKTIVEWMARADLNRKVWEHLEGKVEDFHHEILDRSIHTFGGNLYCAAGTARESSS